MCFFPCLFNMLAEVIIVSLSITTGSCSKEMVVLYPYQLNRSMLMSNNRTTEYHLTVGLYPRTPREVPRRPHTNRAPVSVHHRDNTVPIHRHQTLVYLRPIPDEHPQAHSINSRVPQCITHHRDTLGWTHRWR